MFIWIFLCFVDCFLLFCFVIGAKKVIIQWILHSPTSPCGFKNVTKDWNCPSSFILIGSVLLTFKHCSHLLLFVLVWVSLSNLSSDFGLWMTHGDFVASHINEVVGNAILTLSIFPTLSIQNCSCVLSTK